MFDSNGMQTPDFEEDEIDVFSELGVGKFSITNSAEIEDPLNALIEDEDEIPEVAIEPITEEMEEIPEVEPEIIDSDDSGDLVLEKYSKFDELDDRLKCGFLKEMILKTLEDISGESQDPIASSPEKLVLVENSVNVGLEGNVAMLEITLANKNGELIKPVSVINTSTGKPTPGSMSSKLPISYRPMARNLNKLLWESYSELKDIICN